MDTREEGRTVDGRYVVKREIARGGGAIVFEAEHRYLCATVALKCLPEQRSPPTSRERLLREARALGRLRHPNIVRALDAGEDAGSPFIALDLLEGRTLQGILAARQQLAIDDVAAIGRQLADGLSAVHQRGIVHRDVKPGNVFVAIDSDAAERIKLLDFGIAALPAEDAELDRKLTQANVILGTPEYMSPERLKNEATVDARSDVYALGVTLYECLTGSVPFSGAYGDVLLQTATQEPPPVRSKRPETPEALARVLERALARDPKERFADASAFAVAWDAAAGSLRRVTELVAGGAARVTPAAGAREQRRYARAPYITPVRIVESNNAHLDGRSEDISEGGLLVITTRECRSGEVVKCKFSLPASGRITEVSATARWVRKARGGGAVGLEFLDLADTARQEIRHYVSLMGGG